MKAEDVQLRIQRVVLWALAARGFFSRYVFHGGSSLYFFYENVRWSEDLAFVKHRSNPDHPTEDLPLIEEALKEAVQLIPALVEGVESAELKCQKREGSVLRFIVKASVKGQRRKTRVNVEIADVVSYRAVVKSFERVLVAVEDPFEIFADKVVALVARAGAWGEPKVRDVLDLYFLGETKGVLRSENFKDLVELVSRKLKDYRLSVSHFEEGMKRLREWLNRPETLEDLRVTFVRYALPSHRENELLVRAYCEQALCFVRESFSGGKLFDVLFRELRALEGKSQRFRRRTTNPTLGR